MDPLQVWVDLQDHRYAKRLIQFLTLRYGDKMKVSRLGKELPGPESAAVLLTDREEAPELFELVILVSREKGLNPYQSGHEIAREILEKYEYEGFKEDPVPFGVREGEWVSVYSPVGGIGKSTLAMGLADILAESSQVLMLSLEGPSAWILHYQYPKAYNLSDFFYCFLIGDPGTRRQQLMEMVHRQENGVYFLPPCVYPDDLTELSKDELTGWMKLLKESFDYVIADLGCQMIRPQRQILTMSDKVCYLIDHSSEGQAKWQDFQVKTRTGRDSWIFCRRGDGGKTGEILLPEEVQLYEMQEGKRRFRKDSAYYSCLEKAVEAWN